MIMKWDQEEQRMIKEIETRISPPRPKIIEINVQFLMYVELFLLLCYAPKEPHKNICQMKKLNNLILMMKQANYKISRD